MYTALLIFFFTAFAVLAWRDLRLALIALAGLLPTYLLRFEIGPIPSTALEGLILITFVVWLVQGNAKTFSFCSLKPWIFPLGLVFAAGCFATALAPDLFSALGILKAYIIEPFLVFLMATQVLARKDWSHVLNALGLAVIGLALYAFVQYMFPSLIPIPWDIEKRVTSFFPYPNALGLFVAPIITAHAWIACKHPKNWLSCTIVFFGLIAIVLAKTEAVYVAIPTALVITYLFSSASLKRKWIVVGVALTLVLVAFAIPISRNKLLLQDYSGGVRLSQWNETWELIQDHPLLGVGLNAYPQALEPYHDARMYEIFQYPHNIVLNTWVELGLLGVIALFWLVFLLIKYAWHAKNDMQISAFAALLTMGVHGLVDVPFFKNDLAVLTMLFLALFITSAQKPKKQTRKH